MKRYFWLITLIIFGQYPVSSQSTADTICILQLNDVYEIAPLNLGRVGGMARVATLVKQQEARYQTLVVVAGDFVSPSVIGATKINGQRVNGRQMVDIMNKTGVDLVTFGNHEFDIPENELQERINESQFTWVSSELLHRDVNGSVSRFYKTKPDSSMLPTYFLLTSVHNQFTIGIITATIQSKKQPWVVYPDYRKVMRKVRKQVSKKSEAVLGLTHLSLDEDIVIMRKLKHLPLIMGGHEHQHLYVNTGKGAIAKADANAKTVYRHLVFREGNKGRIKIISELINMDTSVVPDPVVASAVKDWEDKAYAAFRAIGLEPDAVVYHPKEPLEGREVIGRSSQTNLGNLITASMLAAAPKAKAALLNSGSIRVDDLIEGVMTQLDIIRTLPFGGNLCEVELSGTLLKQILNIGSTIKGEGGYLQLSSNLTKQGNNWMLRDKVIEASKTYTIVSIEFLFSGAEKGFEFLKEGHPGIKAIRHFDAPGDIRTDLRLAVVKYLEGLDAK